MEKRYYRNQIISRWLTKDNIRSSFLKLYKNTCIEFILLGRWYVRIPHAADFKILEYMKKKVMAYRSSFWDWNSSQQESKQKSQFWPWKCIHLCYLECERNLKYIKSRVIKDGWIQPHGQIWISKLTFSEITHIMSFKIKKEKQEPTIITHVLFCELVQLKGA